MHIKAPGFISRKQVYVDFQATSHCSRAGCAGNTWDGQKQSSTQTLTDEGINDMPLLHLGFRDGCVIGTSHFDEPRRSHHWNSVFCQITKDLFLLAEDGYLQQNGEGESQPRTWTGIIPKQSCTPQALPPVQGKKVPCCSVARETYCKNLSLVRKQQDQSCISV